MSTTLVLGGIKSGKSRLAEQFATDSKLDVFYIATAKADDKEMQARITKHQQQRPTDWQTIESPIELATTINALNSNKHCVLVDCLTLWLTNLLMLEKPEKLQHEIELLLYSLKKFNGELILVSNETSMGIVPLGELTRQFCDQAGLLHQQLAEQADRVILTIAGLPHVLKGKL